MHVQVARAETECVPSRTVYVRDEEHVIDLGVEVDAAVSGIEASRGPVDPGVLEEVRRGVPVRRERKEEDHLLPAANVVDDGSGRTLGEPGSRRELEELLGDARVGDAGGVVPQTGRRHGCPCLQPGGGEGRRVAQGDKLFDSIPAAVAEGSGSRGRVGESIEPNHAHAKRQLVRVQRIPLRGRQRALVAASGGGVAHLAEDDDGAKVPTGWGRVESWKRSAR